ncbi:MAG: DUF4347 domain-containing protein [Thiomicrospira sp.]|jgi:hypothetical protein|nr:DUF4347 domain-containing protein [Thiomicrospira sp.]
MLFDQNTSILTAKNGVAIAFIDAGLPDLTTLYQALPQGMAVHWLDGDQNGIETISQVLAGQQEIDSIHLITHGAPGRIFIGNQTLSQANLSQHQTLLDQITRTLGENGEWYIYGCDVAQGRPSHRRPGD